MPGTPRTGYKVYLATGEKMSFAGAIAARSEARASLDRVLQRGGDRKMIAVAYADGCNGNHWKFTGRLTLRGRLIIEVEKRTGRLA